MMRIGMVAQSMSRANGGVSEAMHRFCEAIADRGEGHALHIFAAEDAYSQEDSRRFDGLATVHLAKAYGVRRFPVAPRLAGLMEAANLDVLHVHGIWAAHGWSALRWHRRTGKPVVIAPHGMVEPWILKRSPRLKHWVSRLFQDDLFRRAATVHVLTDNEGRDVRALYPQARLDEVPNLVPPAPPHDGQHPGWWADSHAGRKIFLFFGRIHRKKGVEELVQAWRRLAASRSGWRDEALLVFCGWVDDFPEFEAMVAEAQSETGSVLYAGPQYGADKWRSFAAADYMLLPSKSEGLPLAILESWSAGVPTIMTQECNLPLGFSTGAAICCDVSPDGIASALAQAADEDPERHAERAAASRRLIAETYSSERVGRTLLAMYEGTL